MIQLAKVIKINVKHIERDEKLQIAILKLNNEVSMVIMNQLIDLKQRFVKNVISYQQIVVILEQSGHN